MSNYFCYAGTQGHSHCGWWIPHRDMPVLAKPGRVRVCLGDSRGADSTQETWVAQFDAVVDDFGTLRKVAGYV